MHFFLGAIRVADLYLLSKKFRWFKICRGALCNAQKCWFCYAIAIGSGSVNKLQVSKQRFGTFGTIQAET